MSRTGSYQERWLRDKEGRGLVPSDHRAWLQQERRFDRARAEYGCCCEARKGIAVDWYMEQEHSGPPQGSVRSCPYEFKQYQQRRAALLCDVPQLQSTIMPAFEKYMAGEWKKHGLMRHGNFAPNNLEDLSPGALVVVAGEIDDRMAAWQERFTRDGKPPPSESNIRQHRQQLIQRMLTRPQELLDLLTARGYAAGMEAGRAAGQTSVARVGGIGS